MSDSAAQVHDWREYADPPRRWWGALQEIQEKAAKLPFANEPYEVAGEIECIAREALS